VKPEVVKPATLEEYADLMWTDFDIDYDRLEDEYRRVVTAIKRQFVNGTFWQRVLAVLPELESRYYVETGFLMATPRVPEVLEKSWDTFWLKTFRRNISENLRWPRPPVGGWLVPDRWFTQIGDAVRSRFVVRYLDGIGQLVEELESTARASGMRSTTAFQATREGYYAAHVSLAGRFEIPRATFDTYITPARVEIQVTTQVKDVIQELLHKFYEERRRSTDPLPASLEWDYSSDAFRASYLGHLAHHMEGLIMELRQEDNS
jgi:hypothetical protein